MNKKALILTSMYYKPHVGGVENSLKALAKIGNNKGFKMFLVCSDASLCKERLLHYEKLEYAEIYRFKNFQPRVSFFKIVSPLINTIRCDRLARKLKKSIPKDTPVLARHYITGLGFRLAGFKDTCYLLPGIVAIQDKLAYKDKKAMSLKNRIILNLIIPQNIWLQRLMAKVAKKNFVFSLLMQKDSYKYLKVSPILVKPGVDNNRFFFRNQLIERNKRHLGKDGFIALCMGRISKQKGFAYAIEALKYMHNQDIKLLFVGDGPEKENLKKMTERLEVSHLVEFYGSTDCPEEIYALADVFLMTSVHEPFGQTILESMASGVPVIAFDSNEVDTASNEIIVSGNTGFIIPFSSQKLAECLTYCYNNRDILEEMKSNCIQEVQHNYNWNKLFNDIFTN